MSVSVKTVCIKALYLTLAGSTADVGDESSAAGMRLGRTHLTRMTPGSANGGTTQCLSADDTAQLALAHLIIDLSKARTRPVVCERERYSRKKKCE